MKRLSHLKATCYFVIVFFKWILFLRQFWSSKVDVHMIHLIFQEYLSIGSAFEGSGEITACYWAKRTYIYNDLMLKRKYVFTHLTYCADWIYVYLYMYTNMYIHVYKNMDWIINTCILLPSHVYCSANLFYIFTYIVIPTHSLVFIYTLNY